ncbi:MAG: hypothetical protein LBT55_05270 [Clostridiaceae bacterium]|jgi:hypothetical protein|nr:hypothetical protein [Clostridiaceae bacterium]
MKNKIKRIQKREIIFIGITLVEGAIMFASFINGWWLEVRIALVVAEVLTFFRTLHSILSKFDKEELINKASQEIIEASRLSHSIRKDEHTKISAGLEMFKDLESYNDVTSDEDKFVRSSEESEIWLITNDTQEEARGNIIRKIYENLLHGVDYYYILPHDETALGAIYWLKKSVDIITSMLKNDAENVRKGFTGNLYYITDDLFNFMPPGTIDIIFYRNPIGGGGSIKGYYSFMGCDITCCEELFYRPIKVDKTQLERYEKAALYWKEKVDKSLTPLANKKLSYKCEQLIVGKQNEIC